MFAPQVARAETRAAAPAQHASHTGEVDLDIEHLPRRHGANRIASNFADIPVHVPRASLGSAAPSRSFGNTLRATVKGRQNDAAGSGGLPRLGPPAPLPTPAMPRRREDEGIVLPDGLLPSVCSEQTDAISNQLNYRSGITPDGPAPGADEFGRTSYNFSAENVVVRHPAGAPARPAGPNSPAVPAVPPSYEVSMDIVGVIQYQVTDRGRTHIGSDSEAAITQASYPQVAADLNPPAGPVVHNGRQFMRNQPFRDRFWARDLTIRHEIYHCNDDVRFGATAVQAAQAWLNTQTANTDDQLAAVLGRLMPRIGASVLASRAPPADEHSAYDDGGPFYRARAQAIKRKGDAKGYAPKPAPQPKAPAKPKTGAVGGGGVGDIALQDAGDPTLPAAQSDAAPKAPAKPPSRLPAPPRSPARAGAACTISSKTAEAAPDGTADTRTMVGVNEFVDLTAPVPCTWSATAGVLIGSGASTTWVAPSLAKATSCSVTARPATGAPCRISFDVLPPRERQMTKTVDHAYSAGMAGSGFVATALILPLNVCFSNILSREEPVAGEATGYYDTVMHWDKGMHPQGAWARVNAANNNIKDTIGSKLPGTPAPFSTGVFYWGIPLSWCTPNDPTPRPMGRADQVQVMMDNTGSEITTKEGAGRERTP